MTKLTRKYLKTILTYDDETGIFRWKPRKGSTPAIKRFNTRFAGQEAGTLRKSGYIAIRFDDAGHLAHRLAFIMMGKKVPASVDHVNGQRADNRWANLRNAVKSGNQQNAGLSKANKSGHKGVFKTAKGTHIAYVNAHGKRRYLGTYKGTYSQVEVAALVRNAVAKVVHGEFYRAS